MAHQEEESATPVDDVVLAELGTRDAAARSGDEHRWLADRRDILKGVSVQLQVKIGSAQVSVGQLAALRDGDVLALEQDARSPVELFVEGQLVGRGELVVVGEKYGVRVTELAPLDAR